MKQELNDLLEYIDDSCIEHNSLCYTKAYGVIKEFLSEMCENQKAECYTNADTIFDSYEWEDEGRQAIYKVDEKTIMECKNVADEL